jgi:hypothetical protein
MNECRLCGTKFNGSGDTAHYCNPVKSFGCKSVDKRLAIQNPATITLPITEYEQLKKINDLAIEFHNGAKITEERVRCEEFWENADEADVDEIDLEETLARLKLFSAIDQAMKEE